MNSGFDYTTLGLKIRKERKKLGLTQEQLAEICDLSTAHIGHIERGTRAVSIESLICLAQALNVSIDYLLLDMSPIPDKNLTRLVNSLQGQSKENLNKLYSIIRILIENVDNLT